MNKVSSLSITKKNKIIISIIAISFFQGLQFSVSPVLRQIHMHYPSVDLSLVQMLVTAPALVAMFAALSSGWLITKVSKKSLLVFGGLIAGTAGFIPFILDSFGLLFFSRALYGIALGLGSALNTAVVVEFFEGDEKTSVMGIQAASVGIGMVVITTLSGRLGAFGLKYSYLINIIGFISMIVIGMFLPNTGKSVTSDKVKIKMNKEVYKITFIGLLELLFLISFSTNISMHVSGRLAGNTTFSGILTGVFSASQIVTGLVLYYVVKAAKEFTLPSAMLSFSIGAVILILFPSNYVMLIIGAIFCGFSQGIFVPQAMCDVTASVKPAAAAMASAFLTCGMFIGQSISSVVLNTASQVFCGDDSTTHVYLIAAVGMTVSAAAVIFLRVIKKNK